MVQIARLVLLAATLVCVFAGCKSSEVMNPPGGVAGLGSGVGGASGTGAAAGASAIAGSSAGGTSGGAGGCGTESFAAIYQSIFANKTYNCTGPLCHGRAMGLDSVGNLSLSSAAVAYTQLVGKSSDSMKCPGKTRVIAGDPKNSLLVQKLRGDTVTCGAPMPVAADEITADELQRVSNWISAGACNN